MIESQEMVDPASQYIRKCRILERGKDQEDRYSGCTGVVSIPPSTLFLPPPLCSSYTLWLSPQPL